MNYFTKSIDACLKDVASSRQGLSMQEAKIREKQLKFQQIQTAKKDGLAKKFLMQFCDLMILILLHKYHQDHINIMIYIK